MQWHAIIYQSCGHNLMYIIENCATTHEALHEFDVMTEGDKEVVAVVIYDDFDNCVVPSIHLAGEDF